MNVIGEGRGTGGGLEEDERIMKGRRRKERNWRRRRKLQRRWKTSQKDSTPEEEGKGERERR